MSRAALIDLVRRELGLDPEVFGARVFDDACAEARRALGATDDAALQARMVADAGARAAALEHFVVGETWFFRAPEQFQDLLRFARGAGRGREPLRVLSLPCASGEEAYSIAMCLLDAGLSATQFEVCGVDVSAALIARARAGWYRRSALRGGAVPSHWISPEGEGFRVDALLRRCVQFRVGNALDALLFAPDERYDVVFCRNLLIYLHDGARRTLLDSLVRALRTPALVLAGQAEVLPSMAPGFSPCEGASPLSYLHGGERTPPIPAPAPPSAPVRRSEMLRAPLLGHAAGPVVTSVASEPTRPDSDAQLARMLALEEARRLADLGQLDAARERCAAQLGQQAQDVETWFLLGLIESARGDAAAADAAFARVLYLDGEHADALAHRLALARRLGDRQGEQHLGARAERLRQRRKVPS